jgi:hypothetical protein
MIKYINHINEDNREQAINLYNFFLKNCYEAKGSSNNHQSWETGYYDHMEEVFAYATKIYPILSRGRNIKLDFTLSDAILVLFLHDIEKPIKYSNYQCQFESDDEIRGWLINEFKFDLKEYHKEALKYIHGEGNDYRKDKRVMSPLSAFCHCCDVISSRIFFDYPKGEDRFKFKHENLIMHAPDLKRGFGFADFSDEEINQLKSGIKFAKCTVSYCNNNAVEKYFFRYCSQQCSE